MLIDHETRRLIAQDHVEHLRIAATGAPRAGRTRRWIGDRLIAVGERLSADCARPRQQPLRVG